MNKKSPVAVFDSGIGGLTVAKRLNQILPGEKIIYFGDTARVPYGTKSRDTIKQYALQIAGFLIRFKPKLIVIACHSVSSLGKAFLEKKFPDYTFIDVIGPSVEEATEKTKNKKIGIIGTPATISSGMYPEMIERIDSGIKVYQKPCPLLVPLVEEGWFDNDITRSIVKYYIQGVLDKQIDTLILGCTHYPLLKKAIRKITGLAVHLVDASDATSVKVKDFLVVNGLLNTKKAKTPVIYFSDVSEYRNQVMHRFWNKMDFLIKKIDTGEL